MLGRVLLTGVLVLAFSALPAAAQFKGPLAKRKAAQQQKRSQMVEKFSRLPPEEQDRMLQKLPKDRRKQIQNNLDRYNELSPEQKKRLGRQYENFQQWPPEKQQSARKIFRRMNGLEEERKVAMRREVVKLRNLPGDRRSEYMRSDSYKDSFSADEQKILSDLADLMAEPRP